MLKLKRISLGQALAATLLYVGVCTQAFGDLIPDSRPTLDLSRVYPALARRDDVPDTTFTNYANSFPMVGKITAGSLSASGVLITPNTILTAGHVIVPGLQASTYQFNIGGNTYSGAATFLPSDWTTFNDSIGKGNDIAIIRLTQSVPNVTPATIYTGADEVGLVGTNVGFGYSGTGSAGQSGVLGPRRAGDNMIDSDGAFYTNVSPKILLQDFDNPDGTVDIMGSLTPLSLESLITQGDSGGGMFADFGAGPMLVGIHSFLDDFNNDNKLANYGDIAGSTSVSRNLAFIQSVVGIVPEPSSFVLSGLGIVMVGAFARKRRG